MKMKVYETKLISVLNDFADEYGTDGLLDELVPGASIGEIIVDMYNAGILPEDVIERFLLDD